MISREQTQKAEKFFSLHTSGKLLVLPNIWDPIGARILEAKGFPAVATASAAISSSLGYDDGEKIKFSTLLEIISRIARSVQIPVTADIETGYGTSIPELQQNIVQVLETGVVGINIEDSLEEGGALRSVEEQSGRIMAVRDAARRQGMHLVINARIDSFVSGSFPNHESRIADAIMRARAYGDAGADCVYPMGPGDRRTLEKLRGGIRSPINVLGTSTATPLTELKEIGINRVSFGPYVFRSCLKKFVDIVDALRDLKGYGCFGDNMMSKADASVYLIHEPE